MHLCHQKILNSLAQGCLPHAGSEGRVTQGDQKNAQAARLEVDRIGQGGGSRFAEPGMLERMGLNQMLRIGKLRIGGKVGQNEGEDARYYTTWAIVPGILQGSQSLTTDHNRKPWLCQ